MVTRTSFKMKNEVKKISLNPSFRGWSLGLMDISIKVDFRGVLILLFVDGHSDSKFLQFIICQYVKPCFSPEIFCIFPHFPFFPF